MRIGIDLMGSDSSPVLLFNAIVKAATCFDRSHSLVVIATHSVTNEIKQKYVSSLDNPQQANIEFHPVRDAIAMTEDPLIAVSKKQESSLVVGIKLLKKNRIDAFVTAGNTGALIASATLNLPKLPGIKRPALLVVLPTVTGSVAVVDVGGTVSCTAHHLVQFAYMGAAYQRCNEGIKVPKVGLLNIGVEPRKGTSFTRQAYQILSEQASPAMQFVGNVEGRDVFQGNIDVLITDGFTGNVLLKTSEGVSAFIFEYIQEAIQNISSDKLHKTFGDLKKYFNSADYPGAIVCGVEGVVVKCHGNASPETLLCSIKEAAHLVDRQLIPHLKALLSPFEN